MFIEAFFNDSQKLKIIYMSAVEWINTFWYIHIMEYYVKVRKNKLNYTSVEPDTHTHIHIPVS